MHKLHGMGSQPQALAKLGLGGKNRTPASACTPPQRAQGIQHQAGGWAGLGAPSMSVQEQLCPGLPGCSCSQPATNLQRWQRSRSPAPSMQPCLPQTHTGGAMGLGQMRGAPQEPGKVPRYECQSMMLSYEFFQGSLRGNW